METRSTSANREKIIHVLQSETGERPVYQGAPGFTVTVGEYSLLRDGRIVVPGDGHEVFARLASMGLCDYIRVPDPKDSGIFSYPLEGHNGRTLMNIVSIISARQRMLNQALQGKASFRNPAFHVAAALMDDLLAHPPKTPADFMQRIYGREEEHKGLCFTSDYITFTGFEVCSKDEQPVHRQLADHIMETAISKQWIKPYTENIRNRKYAFRIWLNSIGMIGPEYEEARRILLGRLYGRGDRRVIPRGCEQNNINTTHVH